MYGPATHGTARGAYVVDSSALPTLRTTIRSTRPKLGQNSVVAIGIFRISAEATNLIEKSSEKVWRSSESVRSVNSWEELLKRLEAARRERV